MNLPIFGELPGAKDDMSLPVLLDSLLGRLDYMNYLDDHTMQGESRQENVRELLSVAKSYQDLGLDGFFRGSSAYKRCRQR